MADPRHWRSTVVVASILIAPLASTQVPCHNQRSLWQATNPGGGGWFERVSAGPTGLVIACSDLSGAYRSRNRGRTWDALGAGRGLGTTHVASVAFHQTDGSVLYLGTDNGIYASSDLGESFTHAVATGYVEHIAVAPNDARVAYAGWHPLWNSNQGQVYKTVNRGRTWLRVDAGLPSGRRILEVLVAPGNPDEVYLLTGDGRFAGGPAEMYRSIDGGVNFTEITGPFGNRLVDVALDPFSPGVLYASVDNVDPLAVGELYRSTNRGATWTLRSRRGGFLWLDRRTPGTIRMIDARYPFPWDPRQGIWESTTTGAPGSWRRTASVANWNSGWSTAFWAFEATTNYGGFGEDFSDPDALYWINTQFAYGTFDRGRTVRPLFCNEVGAPGSNRWQSRGFDNVVILDLALNEANPDELYAAFLDLGTWRSLDRGRSWTPINDATATGGWSGAGGNTWSVLTDPSRPGVVWAPQSGDLAGPSTLLRSTSSGSTWSVVGSGLPAAPILGLSLDRGSQSSNRTLFCTADGNVYRSTDDGRSWALRLSNGGLRCTAVDRHQRNIVYAGGESGLWRSTASGAPGTWTEIGLPEMRGPITGLPDKWWRGVYDVVPDPQVSGRVYAVAHGPGRGLYRSADFGTSWQPRLITDPHLWCAAVDPTDSSIVYATSSCVVESGGYEPNSRGVLRSRDGGQSWQEANEGLAWPFAIPIVIDPSSPCELFVGSPGTGIHRRVAETLRSDTSRLAASGTRRANFSLDAGSNYAGRSYILAATRAGTTPGFALGNVQVPLNFDDALFEVSLLYANTAFFVNTLGLLDSGGRATATFAPPTGLLSAGVGGEFAFAFVTLSPFDLASNPISISVVQ